MPWGIPLNLSHPTHTGALSSIFAKLFTYKNQAKNAINNQTTEMKTAKILSYPESGLSHAGLQRPSSLSPHFGDCGVVVGHH